MLMMNGILLQSKGDNHRFTQTTPPTGTTTNDYMEKYWAA